MHKKYKLLFVIALIMTLGNQIVSYNLYAKEKTSKDTPGTAIFVMAMPKEIKVESKVIRDKNEEISIDIKYPKLVGLSDKKFEKILNYYFKNNSLDAKRTFTKEAKLYNTHLKELSSKRCYELVQNFTITETEKGYFIIELFEYTYTGENSGSSSEKYMVLDVINNKIVMLKDLLE